MKESTNEPELFKALKTEFFKSYGNTEQEFMFFSILKMFMRSYFQSIYERNEFKLTANKYLQDFLMDDSIIKELEDNPDSAMIVTSPAGTNIQHFNPKSLNTQSLKKIIEFCETNNYDVILSGDSLTNPGNAVQVEFTKRESKEVQ